MYVNTTLRPVRKKARLQANLHNLRKRKKTRRKIEATMMRKTTDLDKWWGPEDEETMGLAVNMEE